MIERIVIVFVIFVLVAVVLRLLNYVLLSQRNRLDLQLDGFELGSPAILYFSSVECQPCQTIQSPAITKLRVKIQRRLQVIEVDAIENPEIAHDWGVLSLPTTYILNSDGRPQTVNQGVVSTERLLKQLQTIR